MRRAALVIAALLVAAGCGGGDKPDETKNGFGDRAWGAPCPPEGKSPEKIAAAGLASGALIGKLGR